MRINSLLGDRRRGRGLDQRDDLVDVGERDREAFQHVAALARLLQLEHGAARDHLAAMGDERVDHHLEVAQGRGWPSTSATMFMPNVSCSCVCL